MFRSRLFPRFGWVLLALVLAAPAGREARAQDTNLLKNPGFEEGLEGHPWMPTGWDTSRAGLETVFFGRDAFSARTGSFGVNVANASAALPFSHHWNQMLVVTPGMWGKDLVFTVWTRNNGVDGRGYVLVQAFRDTVTLMAHVWNVDRPKALRDLRFVPTDDPSIDLAWNRVSFTDYETDWVPREVRIYVPPTSHVVFVRCGLIGTGQVMFDDASLTLVDAAPPAEPALNVNLLKDPGFEGDLAAWELSMPPYPTLKAVRDTVARHGGAASLRFSGVGGMATGKSGAAQPICDRALSGKRVRMTAWIKADSLRSAASLKLFCHTRTGMAQEASSRSIVGTADWTPVIVEMDVPKDTYTLWAWITYMAPSPGILYMDDASLEVLGPATGEPTPLQDQFPDAKKPAKTPAKAAGKSRG